MPEIGAVLAGRYRIVRVLGQGGMGCVYEGVHERLRRPVAIKVLKPDLAAEHEYRVRFEREARAAALLKSTHAVRVFDVDVTEDGAMYLVMELLAGRDLGKEAAQFGPLDSRDVVEWIAQSCEALAEAHANGIVHRDIKPGNIFLADEKDGERVAKVVDFGISKFSEAVTSALTNPLGGFLGTPHYMAPEQLRGHRIDGRADIWALGVTMYRVLGGRLPFDNTKGDGAYLASVLSDTPFPFEQLRPDLPIELSAVIMRALERLPADRFASAEELAEALARFGWWGSNAKARVVPNTELAHPATSTARLARAATATSAATATAQAPALAPVAATSATMTSAASTPHTLIPHHYTHNAPPPAHASTPIVKQTAVMGPPLNPVEPTPTGTPAPMPTSVAPVDEGSLRPAIIVGILCTIALVALAYGARRYLLEAHPTTTRPPPVETAPSAPPAPSATTPPAASTEPAPSPSAPSTPTPSTTHTKPGPHRGTKPTAQPSTTAAPAPTPSSDFIPDHL